MKKHLFLLCCLSLACFAHPHMFVDIYFNVDIRDDKLEKIRISWVLDEMTSTTLLMDYDRDKDGQFDTAETLAVKTDAFDHLKESHYLTYIGINKKRIPTSDARDFSLSTQNNRVVYHFTLTPGIRIDSDSTLKLACYDPENFMAMEIDESRTTINQNKKAFKIASRVDFEDHDYFVADMLIIQVEMRSAKVPEVPLPAS